MKLLELYKTEVSFTKTKGNARQADDSYREHDPSWNADAKPHKNKLIKVLGTGVFGTAIEHGNSPGEVTKVSRPIQSLKHDGYFRYLTTILRSQRLQDNPYLPKIYKIKIYKSVDGEYFYIVKMEKLHNIKNASTKELEAINDRIWNELPDHSRKDWHEDKDALRYYVTDYLERVISNPNLAANIKDDDFRQALAFVKKAQTNGSSNRNLDLHDGNVMLRRTSVGAQLVLTDPLS
jgi:hypothetical protein